MRKPNSLEIGFFEIAKRSAKKAYLEDDVLMYAAALAFRAFFALIPFLIFLVALLGFLQVPGFFGWLLGKAQNVLSKDALGQAELVLRQVRDQAHGGFLALAAVAVAIWYGSVGVRSLMSALNIAYGVEDEYPAWKSYPLSIVLTVGLMLAIALVTALMLVGPKVMANLLSSQIGLGQEWVALWSWVRWPLAVILLLLSVAVVYHFGPNTGESFRLLTPGAVLAVTVWMGASLGFHYYVLNFANYSVMYGSLGAVLMLLFYFYISAAVLLLGAEVNAVIRNASSNEAGSKS